MYKSWVESILVIVLAGLGLADAWRLSGAIRAGSAFHDIIGPDRYLGVISAGLFICGMWNLMLGFKATKTLRSKREERERSPVNPVVLVTSLLVVYIFVFPILGYLLATSIFFPVIYFIFGVRPWPKSVFVGLITTALFYVIFAYLAEMPLPKGLFESIL